MSGEDVHLSSVLGKDAHLSSVLGEDVHMSSVLGEDVHLSSVLDEAEEALLAVVTNPSNTWLGLSKETVSMEQNLLHIFFSHKYYCICINKVDSLYLYRTF